MSPGGCRQRQTCQLEADSGQLVLRVIMVAMFFATILLAAVGATADFSPAAYAALPAWENPYVTSSNRLPARTVMVPCPTRDLALKIAALKETRDASPFVLSLNGKWDFRWAKDPYAEPGPWTRIDVPSCWQLQGLYDPPQYCNVEYPHVVDPPRIMTAPPPNFTQHAMRNPTGRYKREFVLPKRWENRKVTLHFNGVASALEAKINGTEVGYSEDSRLPCEFDVTPFVKMNGATNVIEATVYRWCDGSYLEDQDLWRLSGIYRDVYLVSEPKGGVYDAVVETALSDDFTRASVRLALTGGTIFQKLELVDPKGRTVGTVTNAAEKIYVQNPELWNCERPKLYTLVLLADQTFYAFNVGFRKVEIKDAVLKVNGKRILVKGANRHEMNPSTGYTLTPADMHRDAELMKKFNVNAVRTCHYPDDPLWYDVCDKVGFWVVCEANVESHGMGYGEKTLAIRPDYAAQHVERGTRMVATYRNHPSVIVWSMGNEAGFGDNFREEFKAMKALDATRPIQYEGACESRKHENFPETEIECPMYAPAFSTGHSHFDYAGFTSVEDYVKNAKKPHVLCEYALQMGNSTGDLQNYWDLVAKHPSAQGGFIWEFADQALWSTTNNNAQQAGRPPFLAFGGDFGDKPNASCFNCNGFFDALRHPRPGAYEIRNVYRDVFVDECDFENMTVTIRNGFLFRNLDGFRCAWQYAVNGMPSYHGSFSLQGLEAGASKLVSLMDTLRPKPPHPDTRRGERTLTFAFFDGARGEVARLQCRKDEWRWRRRLDAANVTWTQTTNDASRVAFGGNGFEVAFDRKTGLVASYRKDGVDLFAGSPAMNFWRVPVDNDRGNGMWDRCLVWREAGAKAQCVNVVVGETNGLPQVIADYAVPAGDSKARFVQTLTPEGGLRVDWTFDAAAGLPEIPRVGLTFEAPLAFDCVCWYGLGPHENYRDRANGAWLGVHNAAVGFVDGFARHVDVAGRPALRYPAMALNPDNYVRPCEQGYRTGVRWLKIGTRKAPVFEIATMGEPFGFNAWPYPQRELENKTHTWEMARAGAITFNVDADQMGVGGDNCWGAFPHDEDLLASGRRYTLSVLISAVPPGKKRGPGKDLAR